MLVDGGLELRKGLLLGLDGGFLLLLGVLVGLALVFLRLGQGVLGVLDRLLLVLESLGQVVDLALLLLLVLWFLQLLLALDGGVQVVLALVGLGLLRLKGVLSGA